jgi:hypothetical protein
MPEKQTIERARQKKQEGKAATTQAGEFVREEMRHLAEHKHGGSRKQAIAVGLQKARRAGVDLPPPKQGTVKAKTQRSAESAYRRGQESGEMKKPAWPKKGITGRRSTPAAAEKRVVSKLAAKKAAAKKAVASKAAATKGAVKKAASKLAAKKTARRLGITRK